MTGVKQSLLLPLVTATNRLLTAGYMTNYDLTAHLFAFTPEDGHVASVPVIDGNVCARTVQALEDKAKKVATCCT